MSTLDPLTPTFTAARRLQTWLASGGLGKLSEAEALFRVALGVRLATVGPQHSSTHTLTTMAAEKPWVVVKYGGTSVSSVKTWETILARVEALLPTNRVWIVVSAVSKVRPARPAQRAPAPTTPTPPQHT